MMASQVFSGALLFAMLFVHVYCIPVKSGFDVTPTYGGSHTNAAPSGYGASSHGSSAGASDKGFAQPAVQGPSASIVGYSGSAVAGPSPGSMVMSGTGYQQGPQDVDWTIQPLSFLSGNDGYSTSEAMGPAYSSYGPAYQGGDLSGYEGSYEHGDSMGEMGGHGYVAPSPMMQEAAMHQYTSALQSGAELGGTWGVHPLYDYMFMTGQYPPGTITHSASSYEQGRDNFADVHYQRYYIPQYTVQEVSVHVPQTPVAAPKGKGKGF
ncbi:uncharacterized protein LOC141793629 [Halichoeres trimaculatus]|uniref:uncharacterized protein LOC141793629 n=1 Tax=Halichoeres trimaculatus TaxID=147232 RepID=UPI003D9EC4A8